MRETDEHGIPESSEFIDELDAKVKLFTAINSNPKGWIPLNKEDSPSEYVYPVSLEMLTCAMPDKSGKVEQHFLDAPLLTDQIAESDLTIPQNSDETYTSTTNWIKWVFSFVYLKNIAVAVGIIILAVLLVHLRRKRKASFIEKTQFMKTRVQIFLSYAKEDKDVAKKLYNDLRREGLELWIDTENLLPGQDWKIMISQAIKNSQYFLALLSSCSVSKTGFVQKELKLALELLDEMSPYKIFIIPVRINECRLADNKLQHLHWVDLFPSYKKGLEQILRVFKTY